MNTNISRRLKEGVLASGVSNMKVAQEYPVVVLNRFIEATRDSGYKNTSAAVAELIDNSFEADASMVEVIIHERYVNARREFEVIVSDNGHGMTPSTLRLVYSAQKLSSFPPGK